MAGSKIKLSTKRANLDPWLNKLFQSTGIQFQKTGPGRWFGRMNHQFASFDVEIVNHGSWITFSAGLVGSVTGGRGQEFYEFALGLNAELNAAHIAHYGNTLVLVKNGLTEDSREDRFFRDLQIFKEAHAHAYNKLQRKAQSLGVTLNC